MFRTYRFMLLGLCVLIGGVLEPAHAQETFLLQRQDHSLIQVTAYAPTAPICLGIGIISPGAGGTEKGYQYLAETMSELGYLAVVVAHPESGRRALREHIRGQGLRKGLTELITEPDAYRGRLLDLAAATRWAKDRCPAEVAILLGHSMGAATVMIEAGARNHVGVRGTDTFNAYIALSPQGSGPIFPENAWSDMSKPVLLLTGTQDTELGGASWETRTEPFQSMPPGCKWLAVIDGASHFNFAGKGLSRLTKAQASTIIRHFLHGLSRGDCRPPPPVSGLTLTTK